MGIFSRKRKAEADEAADNHYGRMGGPFEEQNIDPSQVQPQQSRLAQKSPFYRNIVFSGTAKDKSVGFWHSSLKDTRKTAFTKWFTITLTLCIAIFCFLSMYWGALMLATKKLHHLTVFVVDFDGQVAPYNDGKVQPLVGPTVVEVANMRNNDPASSHLGYVVQPASDFGYNVKTVWKAVYDEKAWAAIIVNANATSLLRSALINGNATYDPKGALQLVYVEARDETTVTEFILPDLTLTQNMMLEAFSKAWTSQALRLMNTTGGTQKAALAPQALNPGIGFSLYNMRPFSEYLVATPTTTVGLIYLIIISFFTFAFYMPVHQAFMETSSKPKPLHFFQWIVWRLCSTIVGYFFLSFFYSLVSLAFRVPFSRNPAPHDETAEASAYGKASWVVYWMLNWISTMALGLACENVGMILGFPWFSLWLIFWVITNVATSFYPIPVEPGFYRFGEAWPLHNTVEATRTIIFDTHSRIGLNIGILCAWVAVNITLFPLCTLFFRWSTIHAKKKEKAQQEENEEEKVESE